LIALDSSALVAIAIDEPDAKLFADAVSNNRCIISTPTLLESSGGLPLASARVYAETGVEFLAVGALTHSVTALDVGLDLRVA